MAIPEFPSLMLPLLRLLQDGREYTTADLRAALASQFALTDEELAELRPSGKGTIFANRVAWAIVHLTRAGLVEKSGTKLYRITQQGVEVLKNPPSEISVAFLKQFSGCAPDASAGTEPETPTDKTPDELLAYAHDALRKKLTLDLVERINQLPFPAFEQLVVDVLQKMGYGKPQGDSNHLKPKGADEGIDGVVSEDPLGLSMIYVQAKRWQGSVSRPEVQKFVGAMQGKNAKKGVFFTTSSFTKEAQDFAKMVDPKVVLVNGEELAQFMIDFNVGVSTSATYEVKQIDSDYFDFE